MKKTQARPRSHPETGFHRGSYAINHCRSTRCAQTKFETQSSPPETGFHRGSGKGNALWQRATNLFCELRIATPARSNLRAAAALQRGGAAAKRASAAGPGDRRLSNGGGAAAGLQSSSAETWQRKCAAARLRGSAVAPRRGGAAARRRDCAAARRPGREVWRPGSLINNCRCSIQTRTIVFDSMLQ